MGAVISTASALFSASCNTLTVCVTCAGCFSRFDGGDSLTPSAVNGIYVTLLGLFMLLGFFLRSLGGKLDVHLNSWRLHCTRNEEQDFGFLSTDPHRLDIYCQGDAAVYRLSFVLSGFFGVLSILSTFSYKFHTGLWGIKFFSLVFACLVVFFIPNSFFDDSGFAWVARIGSIFFLALQILLLIDFAYEWNERWMELAFPDDGSDHNKKYIFAILAVSLTLYMSVFIGIPIFFTYFPENLIFSSITLGLIILLTALTFSRHQITGDMDLRGEILPAAVISAYSMYLLWSALDSDVDESKEVDKFHSMKLLVGVIFAVLSLMYTVFNTSNNLGAILGTSDDEDDDFNEPLISQNTQPDYNYQTMADDGGGDLDSNGGGSTGAGKHVVLFHLLMMSASMYMAMLLTNWGVNEFNVDDQKSHGIRKGNMWVKLISQWTTVALYIWTLFAPALLSNRDFD